MKFGVTLQILATLGVVSGQVTYKTLADSDVQWADVSVYDSYKWNPSVNMGKANTVSTCAPYNGNCSGDFTKVTASEASCPAPYSKADLQGFGVTTGQAEFLTETSAWSSQYAYYFTAGFSEGGFGRWSPLGHGYYCPTMDPLFWYNAQEDAFIWWNNGEWSFGKPSVVWWFEVAGSDAYEGAWNGLAYNGESVNVLTFGNYACTSDVEGRLFVGGNLNVDSYSVGDKIDRGEGLGADFLVVGGDATFGGGRVYYGDMVLNPDANNQIAESVSYGFGDQYGNAIKYDANRFDFAGAEEYYGALSSTLAAMSNTGSTSVKTWEIRFTGSGAETEVFSIECGDLWKGSGSSRQFQDLNNAKTIIINVQGDTQCGFKSGGFFWNPNTMRDLAPKILYNFPCAQQLEVDAVGVEGSILAPHAALGGAAGVIWGQIIVESYNTMVQQNTLPFTGNLPEVDYSAASCGGDSDTSESNSGTTTAAPTAPGSCEMHVKNGEVYKCHADSAKCLKSNSDNRRSWTRVDKPEGSASTTAATTPDGSWTADSSGIEFKVDETRSLFWPCECTCQEEQQ